MPTQNIGFLVQVTADTRGARKAEAQLRRLQRRFRRMGIQARVTETQTKSFGDNLGRLASRAALTIPIWFALRGAISALSAPFTSGAKLMQDFSKAMTFARVTTLGTVDDLDAAMQRVTKGAVELGTTFGISSTEVVTAFQKFKTIGIGFEDSLAGMNAATKLSAVLQGDLTKTAKTLAQAYNLLGDTVEQTLPPQERLELISAKIFKQFQINRFEIDEFSQSFDNFVSTADRSKLTLDEVIVLLTNLSTAGLGGGTAGRLLKTSFAKFKQNLDVVKKDLQIIVTDEDAIFDKFLETLRKLRTLEEAGEGLKASEISRRIFGGTKGGRPVQALIGLLNKLEKEFEDLGTAGGTNFKKIRELQQGFNDAQKETIESLNIQIQNFKNLNAEIGKAFITGITGGSDFVTTLEDINNNLRASISFAKQFGEALSEGIKKSQELARRRIPPAFAIPIAATEIARSIPSLFRAAREARRILRTPGVVGEEQQAEQENIELTIALQEGDLTRLRQLRDEIKLAGDEFQNQFGTVPTAQILTNMDRVIASLEARRKASEAIQTRKDIPLTIDRNLQLEIDKLDNQLSIIQMQAMGVDSVTIAHEELRNKIEEVAGTAGTLVENIDQTAVESAILARNWEEVLQLIKDTEDPEKRLLELIKESNKIAEEGLKRRRELVNDLKGDIQSAFESALSGDKNFIQALSENIGSTFKKQLAKALTERVTNLPGFSSTAGGAQSIFDLIAGRPTAGKGGAPSGQAQAQQIGNTINQSLQQGGKSVGGQIKTALNTGGQGLASRLLNALSGLFGFGGAGGGGGGLFKGGGLSGITGLIGGGLQGLGGLIGGIPGLGGAGSLLGGAGSLFGGIGGAAGGAGAAAGLAGGLGAVLGPIGAIAALGFGIAGIIKGFKSKTVTSPPVTRQFQVASRIDVTNKKLDIVNRNLTALKSSLEAVFILPESAFFSENRGSLEDFFSINSRRGIT